MANVQISDLPFATIPLVGATTFFEVEATEGGVVVSRRVAADDLVISATTLFIDGTSVDNPAVGGGVFDGQLLWRNANAIQTGVFGFDPAGDNFIWSNDAEGGFHQIAIRDGTVLVETIAAAAGGLLANNLLTGAGLERVLTTADLIAAPSLGSLTDVTLTAPATGAVLYKSAGDWLDTPGILIDPAADVKLHQATVEVFRTLGAAAGGAEANNTLTGGGFERVLTASDLFAGVVIGTSSDDPTNPAGGGTYDATLAYQNSLFAPIGEAGFDPAGDTFRVFNRVRRGSFAVRVITSGGVEEDTYRYDGFAGTHVWLDVLNAGLVRMRLDPGLSAVTCVAQVNDPVGANAQIGNFHVETSTGGGGETSMLVGFPASGASTLLQLKNFVHGGQIRLVGENAAGVEQILFLADPDDVSQMYFAGSRTIVTMATGTSILGLLSNDPTTGGVQDSTIQFQNLTPVPVGDVGFVDGDANIILYNRVHGGDIILRGEDESGNVREVYKIDFENVAGGLAHVWREPGGTQQLMRLDTGINAVTQKANIVNQPSGGFAQVGLFRVQNRNASVETSMHVGFNETIGQTTLELKNYIHGGPLTLVGETAAGVERVLFFHDPDQVGPIFVGILDNDPTVDASIQDARVTFRNPSANNIWQIGFLDGTNDFSIRLFQDTGLLRLRGSSAASADTLLATFDPVADAKLFQAGVEVARTNTAALGGFFANNTLTGAGFERVLTTGDLGGAAASGVSPFDIASAAATDVILTLTENVTLSATLQHTVATDITVLRNEVNSGHIELRGRSSSGGDALMARLDPDNQVTLFWDENQRLRTAQFGTEFIGSAATGSTLRFFGSNGTTLVGLMTIGGGSINEIQMIANATNNGQAFRLLIPDAGGTQRLIWSGDPDGAMGLYFIGVEKVRTRAQGIDVIGDGADVSSIQMLDSAFSTIGQIDITAALMTIECQVNSDPINLVGRSSGSVVRQLIQCDPDDDIAFFDVGVEVARTLPAASGGFEANNTLTGAGFERVLTIADRTDASVYTLNAVVVQDRTLLASASATTLNNNNVLAALITDLQSAGIIQ